MKKAIIVGASSGLGRGVAEILVRNDFQVAITGRRTWLLEECKKNTRIISLLRDLMSQSYHS